MSESSYSAHRPEQLPEGMHLTPEEILRIANTPALGLDYAEYDTDYNELVVGAGVTLATEADSGEPSSTFELNITALANGAPQLDGEAVVAHMVFEAIIISSEREIRKPGEGVFGIFLPTNYAVLVDIPADGKEARNMVKTAQFIRDVRNRKSQ